MLARILTRREPVRYAHPGLSNYLPIVSRAYSIPRLAARVLPLIEPAPGLLQQLLHGAFNDGDESALAMFLDAHQDVTGMGLPEHVGDTTEEADPHAHLIDLLSGMYRVVRDAQDRPGHGVALENFTDASLGGELPRRLLSGAYTDHQLQAAPGSVRQFPALDILLAQLTRHRPEAVGGTHVLDELDHLYNQPLPEGDHQAFVRLHDLAQGIAQHRPGSPNTMRMGQRVRDATSNALYHLASRIA